jgi:hypothetical protein
VASAVYKRRSRVRAVRVLWVAVIVGRDERYFWRAANGEESLECWRDESRSSGDVLLSDVIENETSLIHSPSPLRSTPKSRSLI